MCVQTHTSTLNSWSLKEISQKKNPPKQTKKKPDSISPAAHTCRVTGNDSEHPLPFDVWLLCEWRASWGLVDLWPPQCLPCWWEGRGSMGENQFIWVEISLFANNKINFSFWSTVGLLWFQMLFFFGGGEVLAEWWFVWVINWLQTGLISSQTPDWTSIMCFTGHHTPLSP